MENELETAKNLRDELARLQESFSQLKSTSTDELEGKESANMQVALAFSLLSLVYTSLVCEGCDDLRSHPLHKELERVKKYLKRI